MSRHPILPIQAATKRTSEGVLKWGYPKWMVQKGKPPSDAGKAILPLIKPMNFAGNHT